MVGVVNKKFTKCYSCKQEYTIGHHILGEEEWLQEKKDEKAYKKLGEDNE